MIIITCNPFKKIKNVGPSNADSTYYYSHNINRNM